MNGRMDFWVNILVSLMNFLMFRLNDGCIQELINIDQLIDRLDGLWMVGWIYRFDDFFKDLLLYGLMH